MTNTDKRAIERLLTLATIVHEALPEDTDPADHFGHPTDDENAAEIANVLQLAERSIWGWCCVRTIATLDGFAAVTYLGGCSYESAEDFERCTGADQAWQACEALLQKLTDAAARGREAAAITKRLRAR